MRSPTVSLPSSIAVPFVLAFFAPALLAQSAVRVVAPTPGPGVAFTNVQAAVNAAANGDIVLVRSGSYPSFSIVAKDVDVVADSGANVTVAGFAVRNLSAGSAVVVRGIVASGGNEAGAQIKNCAGHVTLEDCVLVGADGDGAFTSPNFDPNGAAGAVVDGSNSVAIVRCQLFGGHGDDYVPFTALYGAGGDGLFAEGSSIALHESACLGGTGGDVNDDDAAWTAGPGGDGADVDATFLFAAGSSFTGGAGGIGGEDFDGFTGVYSCGNGGDGGHGLNQSAPAVGPADVHLLASVANGGAGGPPYPGAPCAFGASGQPDQIQLGGVSVLQSNAFEFSVTSVVREGQNTTFVFGGDADSPAFLLVAGTPSFLWAPTLSGMLLVDPSALVIWPGLLDTYGNLTYVLPAALALPALTGTQVRTQALFFSALSQNFVFGPASVVTVLDSAL
jgi:hypothetical protein